MDAARLVLDFIQALAWPAIAAIVLWKLFPHLRSILDSRNFSIRVGGLEVSAQKASDELTRFLGDMQDRVDGLEAVHESLRDDLEKGLTEKGPENSANDIAKTLERSFSKKSETVKGISSAHQSRTRGRNLGRILWVDDHPENNAFEAAILEEDGAAVLRVRSSRDAVSLATPAQSDIDVVVTDMVREEDRRTNYRAGFDVAREIREANIDVPIILYCSYETLDRLGSEPFSEGITAVTASSSELLSFLNLERLLRMEIDQILREEGIPYSMEAEFGGIRFDFFANLKNVALPIEVKSGRSQQIIVGREELEAIHSFPVAGAMPQIIVVTRYSGQILVGPREEGHQEVLRPSDYLHVIGVGEFRTYVRKRLGLMEQRS